MSELMRCCCCCPLSTIPPYQDLFHTLAEFGTFLSAGCFCLAMKFSEWLLTGSCGLLRCFVLEGFVDHLSFLIIIFNMMNTSWIYIALIWFKYFPVINWIYFAMIWFKYSPVIFIEFSCLPIVKIIKWYLNIATING